VASEDHASRAGLNRTGSAAGRLPTLGNRIGVFFTGDCRTPDAGAPAGWRQTFGDPVESPTDREVTSDDGTPARPRPIGTGFRHLPVA
jgi:hypothetical protein